MDVLKAAGKVGAAGRQAMAAAVQQQQLVTERKVLAELRAGALSLRARIGEEMFKLWKAGQPCPRWLVEICQELESTAAAIGRQRALIDQLATGAPMGEPEPDENAGPPAIEEPATALDERAGTPPALPPLPARQSDPSLVTCPTCGDADAGGRRFCGSCGSKLA